MDGSPALLECRVESDKGRKGFGGWEALQAHRLGEKHGRASFTNTTDGREDLHSLLVQSRGLQLEFTLQTRYLLIKDARVDVERLKWTSLQILDPHL